jgi:hypothetical protein
MWARMRRIRSMAWAKSGGAPWGALMPFSAARPASWAMCAERITAFDGTQPTLRQSPPIRCRSISATFAPRLEATSAVIRPPVPAPMTTRL